MAFQTTTVWENPITTEIGDNLTQEQIDLISYEVEVSNWDSELGIDYEEAPWERIDLVDMFLERVVEDDLEPNKYYRYRIRASLINFDPSDWVLAPPVLAGSDLQLALPLLVLSLNPSTN